MGRLAHRNEVVGLRPCADLLQNHGVSGAHLSDDGEESSFGCDGDSAVSRIVAKPDHIGDSCVEVGQVQRGNVAGGTVDREPGAGLPNPVRNGVAGQCVVDPDGAADRESAVCDVVNLAGGPFFLTVVDEERADF